MATTTALPAAAAALTRRVRVARGDAPGDLLLTGGRVVNVFTGTIQEGHVVIADGRIAGVGPYEWDAAQRIDVSGRVILPGLVDAHIHVESTLLTPAQLARVIVPHGTATIIADPHEIANVLGADGVRMMIEASAGLPLDIFYMAPSCVPAVAWEHAGAVLDADAIDGLLAQDRVLGLAEMMNFPGVLNGDPEVHDKIARAVKHRAMVDGHAPGVTGRDIMAYAAAGIRSDHESTTVEEALEKAAAGMLLQVREGTMARNLDTLLPLMAEDRLGDWCLCTDDVHPDELIAVGHIDGLLRRVVAGGVPAARAVRHATLVPARHYGLTDRGAVAPGWRADLVIVGDLEGFDPVLVVKDGRVVASEGKYLDDTTPPEIPQDNTVNIAALNASAFRLALKGDRVNVIGIVPDQIVTRHDVRQVTVRDGHWSFDPADDVALVASIERHRASGNVGLGLVSGFGFRQEGAIGSSVAHDSHNLIVAGTNPTDMLACAETLARIGGGFVVASGGQVKATLPLPVAGLLSDADPRELCRGLAAAREAAATLGRRMGCPFGTLSFLALSVIPALRITDQGLYDVAGQQFVTIEAG